MEYYSKQISDLIGELSSLPGVGSKSAQRIAFHILNMPKDRANSLANAISSARENVKFCKTCFTLTDQEVCPICSSNKRNKKVMENYFFMTILQIL